jgi:two-component system nitrate/nitrite response regulator NarL
MKLPEHIHLTPIERRVAGYIRDGWNNAQIAQALGCTENTVKRHLYHIFDKTGHGTRLELAAFLHRCEVQQLQDRIAALEAKS